MMRKCTAVVPAMLAIAAGPAVATEICVACKTPDVTYRCTVKNADTIAGLAGDKALRKICKRVLKSTGAHASCTIIKGSGPCPGIAKLVDWDDVKQAATSEIDKASKDEKPATAGKPEPKKPAGVAPPAPSTQKPPTAAQEPAAVGKPPSAKSPTTGDITRDNAPIIKSAPAPDTHGNRDTAQASTTPPQGPPPPPAEADSSIGDKMKGAAEKTWDCVSSLFKKC